MSSSTAATVLVADDDEDIRALVAFTLRRAGFTVVTALSAVSRRGRGDGKLRCDRIVAAPRLT